MNILGTGLSGLVGSRIIELLKDKIDFEDLSLESGVDITNRAVVDKYIAQSRANTILHMAAITDVDGCEKDKKKGEDSMAWKVNVGGTRNIISAAEKYNKKVIYISTDFVFSGKDLWYNEESKPNPINWYGETKYQAEKAILKSGNNSLVVRLAFPYRAKFEREDIVRFFLNRLKNNERIKAVDDWIFTPTFIDDISQAFTTLFENDSGGIYHVVGSSSHSPFEMANLIAEEFSLDKNLIDKVKLDQLFAEKAPRPKKLIMKNDKIEKLGIKMSSLKDGIKELKKQLYH